VLYTQAVAEQLGLNLTDLSCTGILSIEGPITAGRLAELTGLTTGAITGAIDRLERAGYVRRESDPNDRRRVVVVPVTEKLVATVAPAFMPMLALTMQKMSSYSEDEIRLFIELITDITEILRDETRRVRTYDAAEGAVDTAPDPPEQPDP
jgi:DNA-binding MarR family transcriptional regulator